MNNNSIGIFDSGIGGLTVFNKLIKLLPDENYIYFGDTKNLPYGSKTKDELIKLAKNIFDFYAKKNVKAVVMACNTTSAVTYPVLKNDYDFEIYPIIQIASKYISKQNINRLGILATQATINSHAYSTEINKYNPNIKIIEQACPEWVQIVENQTSNDIESIELIKHYLNNILKENVDKIVLGCTHYPYLRNVLSKFADSEMFIDPAEYFVNHIYNDLTSKDLLAEKKVFEPQFIVSSEPEKFKDAAQLFYKLDKKPELIIANNVI